MDYKQSIADFEMYLRAAEKSDSTVDKYTRDVRAFCDWLDGRDITKDEVIGYKNHLKTCDKHYSVKSINSMLIAVNSYLDWLGMGDCRVKTENVQNSTYIKGSRNLEKHDYLRLLRTALEHGKIRLYLIMQTICATGIRISELRYVTVEAITDGMTEVTNKKKTRTIFIPEKLCAILRDYAAALGITSGMIFVTKSGNAVDRSNVWSEMKKIAAKAGVMLSKVFPHNLRHLFAKVYYAAYKDVVHLADILGHSSVNTTRIYTAVSDAVYREQIEKLGIVLDIDIRAFTT